MFLKRKEKNDIKISNIIMKLDSAGIYLDENYWLDVTYKVPKIIKQLLNEDIMSKLSILKKGIPYNLCIYRSTGPGYQEVFVVTPPQKSYKSKELYYMVYFPFEPYEKAKSKVDLYIDHFFEGLIKVMEIEKVHLYEGFFEELESVKNEIKKIAVGNPEYEINNDDDARKYVNK